MEYKSVHHLFYIQLYCFSPLSLRLGIFLRPADSHTKRSSRQITGTLGKTCSARVIQESGAAFIFCTYRLVRILVMFVLFFGSLDFPWTGSLLPVVASGQEGPRRSNLQHEPGPYDGIRPELLPRCATE